MFIVEVLPDWHLAPGEPGADLWVPAMPPASAVLARDIESTFEDEFSATAFLRSMRALAPTVGVTNDSASYQLRIREILLADFVGEREPEPPPP